MTLVHLFLTKISNNSIEYLSFFGSCHQNQIGQCQGVISAGLREFIKPITQG